jgi:hypothetical protein
VRLPHVFNLLGIVIHLEDLALGAVPVIVRLIISVIGFTIHNLRDPLDIQLRRRLTDPLAPMIGECKHLSDLET